MPETRRVRVSAPEPPESAYAEHVVVTARIPTIIHRRARARLGALGITLQGALLREVIRISEGGNRAAIPPPPAGLTQREEQMVAALLRILRGANKAAKLAVSAVLRAFDRGETE